MKIGRREFVVATGTAAAYALLPSQPVIGESKMHGLIGKMIAVEGKRDELIKILLDGVSGMPGCLSYVVAKNPKDPNAIWITEVWDSPESRKKLTNALVSLSGNCQGQTAHRRVRRKLYHRTDRRAWLVKK